jgi:ubiquitin C-terminal hydrolase
MPKIRQIRQAKFSIERRSDRFNATFLLVGLGQMKHLGTEPQWVHLSGQVDFPADVSGRYHALLTQHISAFERDLSLALHNRTFSASNVIVQPRGLTNQNYMCFANSSIQLLLASPFFLSFAHFMKTQLPLFAPRQVQVTPAWQAFCTFLSGFQFSDSASSDGSLPSLKSLSMTQRMSPTNLKILDPVFGPFSSTRKPASQEDAIEFLMHFLNILHEEILNLIKIEPPPIEDDSGWRVQGTGRRRVPLQETHDTLSPLSDLFAILVRAETLDHGKSRTMASEAHLLLPLEIREKKTLEEAIESFTSKVEVSAQVSKVDYFETLPQSIIFGLKRFAFDQTAKETVKLHNKVEYPEILGLKAPGDDAPREYQLSAVVEHLGQSPGGGHYICYVRRFDGTWLKFDDDKVNGIAPEQHLHAQAYLLLYNRITSARA